MSIKLFKKKRLFFSSIILVILTLMLPLVIAFGAYQNNAKDPGGDAPKEAKQAIAKGKTLVGKTDYWLVHNDEVYKDVPKTLDCSSFVRWAYMHGAGMDMGEGNTNSFQVKFKKYLKHGNDYSRGDLLYFNGANHIAIALGGRITLGCDGVNGNGGPRVSEDNFKFNTYDNTYIDMSEALKDKSLWKDAEKTGDPGSDDADGDGIDDSNVGKKGEAFNPFSYKKYSNQNTGIMGNNHDLLDGDTLITVDNFAQQAFGIGKIILVSAGAILATFMSLVLVWYFALPIDGSKLFEKVTGMQAVRNSSNSREIFTTFFLALGVYAVTASNLYIYFMALVLRVVNVGIQTVGLG